MTLLAPSCSVTDRTKERAITAGTGDYVPASARVRQAERAVLREDAELAGAIAKLSGAPYAPTMVAPAAAARALLLTGLCFAAACH